MARWALPAVFPLGWTLVYLAGAQVNAAVPGPRATAAEIVRPATAPTNSTPNAGASQGAVNQPQAEIGVLKQDALATARQVAEAYPQDALAYALLGSAAYNTGRSEEATKQLRKCLELSPEQTDAYDILARVAYEKGNPEEAASLCRDALKLGPANSDILNRLGRALMDLGRNDEAIQTLQEAVRLPKPTSESYYLLGQAHLQAGSHAQAKESFLRAIALVPDHTQAFFGLYTACARLGQTEEAARYRTEFVKLEATDRRALTDRIAQEDALTGLPLVRTTVARTFFGAAQIYRVHGEGGKAAELFLKAARLDADTPVYRAALEAYYVQQKALAEGVAAFEQLAAEQPQSGLNYFYLGRLQGRLDQFEAAERAYRKVQQLEPDWSEGYRALAELYLRANRKPAEARDAARRLVQLDPTGPHYYLLAVACVKNNDRAGAVEAAKQAVALTPGEKRLQEFLQQLQRAP